VHASSNDDTTTHDTNATTIGTHVEKDVVDEQVNAE